MDNQFIFGVIDNDQNEAAFRTFDSSEAVLEYIRGMKGCNIDEVHVDCMEEGQIYGEL
jgi:hypothetical protein